MQQSKKIEFYEKHEKSIMADISKCNISANKI